MFGTFRFFLAMLVLVDHLPGGVAPGGGSYAVFAFYLLSGYLMTLVLNETYPFTGDGIRRFLVNRALRIYPPYLAALLLAICVFLLRYAVLGVVPPALAHPTVLDQLGQVLLVDLPGEAGPRWIPPTWSLDVEVAFYVAMVFLARRRAVVLVWLAASLAFLAHQLWTGDNFLIRYFTYASASLPFSIGSALYHLRGFLPRPPRAWAIAAFVAFAVNAVASHWIWRDPLLQGFYVSLALALVVAVTLRDREALRPSRRFRSWDSWLGDLAYPIFLCHHAVGVAIGTLLPSRMPYRSAALTGCAIVLSVLVARILHRTVEVPIAAWRDRVRPPRARREPVAEPVPVVLLDPPAEPARVRSSS